MCLIEERVIRREDSFTTKEEQESTKGRKEILPLGFTLGTLAWGHAGGEKNGFRR